MLVLIDKDEKNLYLSRNERFLVINVNQYVISWCVRNSFCEGKISKVIFIALHLLFVSIRIYFLSVLTQLLFCRFFVLVLRQAAVLLQRADGALAHHWLPAKLPVVNHFDHQWRHVQFLPGQPLGTQKITECNMTIQMSSSKSFVILIFLPLIQLDSLVENLYRQTDVE